MGHLCLFKILCLLLFATVATGARRARYMLQWHSFDCLNRWPEFGNVSCRIGPENKQLLNIDSDINQPIQQVLFKYKFLVHRPMLKNDTVLFDASLDGCEFLASGVMNNKLVLKIYDNMIKDSNLPKKCPLEKGHLYFHNVNVLNGLPAFMPEIDFTLILALFKPNSADGIDVTVKGSLVELNRVRQKFWH